MFQSFGNRIDRENCAVLPLHSRSERRLFAGLLAVLLIPSICFAQSSRPGRLPSEERRALLPGLRGVFTSAAESATVDARSLRMAAIYVPPGESPAVFTPAGRFACQLQGYLKLQLRGEAEFSFVGRGAVSLWLNDALVARIDQGDLSRQPPVNVELVKGYNKLRIEYESPASGPAQMRLLWASEEFPVEPVPPTLLFHDGRDQSYRTGALLRAGRMNVTRRQCLNCHASNDLKTPNQGAMPELQREAPRLTTAGKRLQKEWIAAWLKSPASLRNKTTMPRVLEHLNENTQASTIADLVEYVASRGEPPSDNSAEQATDTRAGMVLFEQRGCLGCHRFSPPAEADEYDRVSLHYTAAKYRPGALAEFLENPRAHYRWSRMPLVPLSPAQTKQVAAYVRKQSGGVIPQEEVLPQGDAARGKIAFLSRGCAACHRAEKEPASAPDLTAPPFAALSARSTHGCLAESIGADRPLPRFDWAEKEREGLQALLQQDASHWKQDSAVEFSQRQWEAMSCRGCHTRDGADAVLPYTLLEEGERGLPAEPIPHLTWAGEKLQPQWTQRLFANRLPYRPRPHFQIRMPSLPVRGDQLSRGLSYEHGFGLEENPQPPPNNALAAIGSQVAAMQTGLACHRCHAIGDKQATAPFEARSTNLSFAADRLRYGFFHRWMRDPMRIDPATKMIKFAPNGQTTGLDRFYNGDAHDQFEAVWHYLQRLNADEK